VRAGEPVGRWPGWLRWDSPGDRVAPGNWAVLITITRRNGERIAVDWAQIKISHRSPHLDRAYKRCLRAALPGPLASKGFLPTSEVVVSPAAIVHVHRDHAVRPLQPEHASVMAVRHDGAWLAHHRSIGPRLRLNDRLGTALNPPLVRVWSGDVLVSIARQLGTSLGPPDDSSPI
jgi:hypothetical protein